MILSYPLLIIMYVIWRAANARLFCINWQYTIALYTYHASFISRNKYKRIWLNNAHLSESINTLIFLLVFTL